MARNRIIYASQSVWANGDVLYRVQSLGSTTTFTSEDIFELGHLDIIDVVDDVPSVAVTLNTNDFGDVETMAILAQVKPAKRVMDATADDTTANLAIVSGTGLTETGYLHGTCVSDFAVTCGNLTGISLWAPVQEECSLGTLDSNIDQTMFMDEVYVNSLEFSYTTGANATENYGAECDNKMWLLNDGKFVTMDEWTLIDENQSTVTGTLTTGMVATLSNGLGFLRKDTNGAPAVSVYDLSADTMTNWPVASGSATATTFGYTKTGGVAYELELPSNYTPATSDRIEAVYAASAYGSAANGTYFTALDATDRPDMLGAVRQGQVEIFIVAPTVDTSYTNAWRLQGVTISADLTREPLSELGHLGPYDRPLTLPVPITVTVDSTAGDLANWALVAQKSAEHTAGSLDQLELADLMASEDLKLIVMIYAQTDEDAGGTHTNRTIAEGSALIGQNYWVNGTMASYAAAGEREYPVKTIVVEHLKVTDEGYTLDLGSNATQTFGFRSTNDLYAFKGYISIENIWGTNLIRRNA